FSVIDGMMDAPMRDVVESLPLADDMRDALVLRRGQMGQLLDCVAALEAGDYDSATFVTGAGELYLTALIWANTAAESLFGEPSPAPEPSSSRAPTVAVLPAAAAGAGLAAVDARGPGPGLAFGAGHRKAPGRGARILSACREFLGRLFGGGGDDGDRRESARA
ncbi:MAG TPA: hypothetical protein VGI07_11395, partial [Solirubrobacteraceae bacterium]